MIMSSMFGFNISSEYNQSVWNSRILIVKAADYSFLFKVLEKTDWLRRFSIAINFDSGIRGIAQRSVIKIKLGWPVLCDLTPQLGQLY